MKQVSGLFPVPNISDTERIEPGRIPRIQLLSGLVIPSGTQSSQFDVLYVAYICQLVFCYI